MKLLNNIFKKSEVWFAVFFIIAYVVGNSIFLQMSEKSRFEMIYTIPFNILLISVMIVFIKRNDLSEYYGFCKVKTEPSKLLFYIPLVIVGTVNIWMGIRFTMAPLNTMIYFVAMVLTGIAEEILFRGLLYKAMCRKNVRNAIIVTSILFGVGHIVNLVNGADFAETICQIFYAAAVGFLLVAVLYAGKSLIPCIITHSAVNSLSTFANDAAFENIQIQVSLVLCLIAGISAFLIFKGCKE